jgi:hypothetical protein
MQIAHLGVFLLLQRFIPQSAFHIPHWEGSF